MWRGAAAASDRYSRGMLSAASSQAATSAPRPPPTPHPTHPHTPHPHHHPTHTWGTRARRERRSYRPMEAVSMPSITMRPPLGSTAGGQAGRKGGVGWVSEAVRGEGTWHRGWSVSGASPAGPAGLQAQTLPSALPGVAAAKLTKPACPCGTSLLLRKFIDILLCLSYYGQDHPN